MDWAQTRIGVLMGGWSAEREVSLNSGVNVLDALQQKGYRATSLIVDDADGLLEGLTQIDLAFNCLHGGFGEDGGLQALLDVLGIPYTGSGMLACALAMDKLRAKQCFQHADLTLPAHMVGVPPDQKEFAKWQREVARKLRWPLVVKPVREGSSLGVWIARDADELAFACESVYHDFGSYFVEAFIPGKEVTAAVLRMNDQHQALPLLELRPKRDFYDYAAKYTPGATEFIVPAALDAETTSAVQRMAVQAHEALDAYGYSRTDFRIHENGLPYLLEVNTSPGMTNTSDLPQEAEAAGVGFADLVELMLFTALKPGAHRPLLSLT